MNVIITGASRGIGFELVKQFLNSGHQVFCLTRNTKTLESIQNQNLHVFSTDLSAIKSIDKGLKQIKDNLQQVDILIHNAGNLVNKPFENMTYEEVESTYKVNVFAPFYVTQQLLDILGKQGPSHIVTISSMGGFQGSAKFTGLAAYSSSKAALACLTECLAEELKMKNCAVNCLAIGAVQTDMLAEAFPGYKAPLTPAQMSEYIYDFALKGHQYYNGKILPVSLSTP